MFTGPPIGIGLLTASVVLGIMIIPFVSAVARDVFNAVPASLKEAAVALGSTRWEILSRVTLPYTRSAIIGAIFLGLGRALGETMAVTFVLGNAHDLSASLLMPSNSIAAAIANEFTEADTDLYRSSLIALAFLLFVVTFLVLRGGQADADASWPVRGEGPIDDRLSAARSRTWSLGLRRGGDVVRPDLARVDTVDDLVRVRRHCPPAVHADDSAAGIERRPAQRLLRERRDGRCSR